MSSYSDGCSTSFPHIGFWLQIDSGLASDLDLEGFGFLDIIDLVDMRDGNKVGATRLAFCFFRCFGLGLGDRLVFNFHTIKLQ